MAPSISSVPGRCIQSADMPGMAKDWSSYVWARKRFDPQIRVNRTKAVSRGARTRNPSGSRASPTELESGVKTKIEHSLRIKLGGSRRHMRINRSAPKTRVHLGIRIQVLPIPHQEGMRKHQVHHESGSNRNTGKVHQGTSYFGVGQRMMPRKLRPSKFIRRIAGSEAAVQIKVPSRRKLQSDILREINLIHEAVKGIDRSNHQGPGQVIQGRITLLCRALTQELVFTVNSHPDRGVAAREQDEGAGEADEVSTKKSKGSTKIAGKTSYHNAHQGPWNRKVDVGQKTRTYHQGTPKMSQRESEVPPPCEMCAWMKLSASRQAHREPREKESGMEA
ncbi:hypothetical protein B0H14DRAFT_2568188 [Mycena olivaceomarginata]|nr:hypothetical protein B0H14DRAFT_2568188 [Mycena olivaceomarginata]